MKTAIQKEVRIRRKDGLYFKRFDGNKIWVTRWTDKEHALVFPSRNQAKVVRDKIRKSDGPVEMTVEANFAEEQ
jgi:hypothetical protein